MSASFYRDLVPLERLAIFTPLGVRFWDTAREAPVGPGLQLEAWREDAPRLRRRGSLTRAGIYILQGLPGLETVERTTDGDPPASPPISRRFVVQVRDDE